MMGLRSESASNEILINPTNVKIRETDGLPVASARIAFLGFPLDSSGLPQSAHSVSAKLKRPGAPPKGGDGESMEGLFLTPTIWVLSPT